MMDPASKLSDIEEKTFENRSNFGDWLQQPCLDDDLPWQPAIGAPFQGKINRFMASPGSLKPVQPRPWRSNSLTPPSSLPSPCKVTARLIFPSPAPSSSPEWPSELSYAASASTSSPPSSSSSSSCKARSQSLTLDVGSLDNSEDEKIEEMIQSLPEGSGMADIKDWLKSLRLHKYTRVLLEFTYEEFLNLNDKVLEQRGVTLGARGKILKNVALVKERPQTLSRLSESLENMRDLDALNQVLREMESIILMPLKPSPYVMMSMMMSSPPSSSASVTKPIQTVTSRVFSRANRHDSGSDSGTELSLDEPHYAMWDTPNEIFKILKKIYNIIMSESVNTEVVAIFVCILERCKAKEAFETSHKQYFVSWLQKLRALWNPPAIRKATDFKRSCRNYRPEVGRRPSVNAFHRQAYKPSGFLGSCGPAGQTGLFGADGAEPAQHNQKVFTPFSQRHSVPEIKPVGYRQVKRYSYQEERRPMRTYFMPNDNEPLTLSSGMNHFLDSSSSLFGGSDSCHLSSTMDSSCKLYGGGSHSRRDSAIGENNASGSSCSCSSSHDAMAASSQFLNSGSSPAAATFSSFVAPPFRRSSEDPLLSAKCHVSSTLFSYPPSYSFLNASSSSSSSASAFITDDFLAVPRRESAQGFHHGSISSGCVSDGSTDSLLEQDLHNLSLSVTQQALE